MKRQKLWRKYFSPVQTTHIFKAISITIGTAIWFVLALWKFFFLLAWSVENFPLIPEIKINSAVNPTRRLWRDRTCNKHISLLCEIHIFSKAISKPLITTGAAVWFVIALIKVQFFCLHEVLGAAVWFVLALMNVNFFLAWRVSKFSSDSKIK